LQGAFAVTCTSPKTGVNAAFESNVGGTARCLLGFNIKRDQKNRVLQVSPLYFFGKMLAKFDMGDCDLVTVPSSTEFASLLALSQDFEAVEHDSYTQVVVSILYPSTISRPDLSPNLSIHFPDTYPSGMNGHWKAAKLVLRYMQLTNDVCLRLDANRNNAFFWRPVDQLLGNSLLRSPQLKQRSWAIRDSTQQASWARQLLKE
jgi:hypothetical protein